MQQPCLQFDKSLPIKLAALSVFLTKLWESTNQSINQATCIKAERRAAGRGQGCPQHPGQAGLECEQPGRGGHARHAIGPRRPGRTGRGRRRMLEAYRQVVVIIFNAY